MYKLVTLSAAAVAATSVDDFEETIEAFKVRIEGSEVQKVERAQRKLDVAKHQYVNRLAAG